MPRRLKTNVFWVTQLSNINHSDVDSVTGTGVGSSTRVTDRKWRVQECFEKCVFKITVVKMSLPTLRFPPPPRLNEHIQLVQLKLAL